MENMTGFTLERPASVADALALLAMPQTQVFAGGTDLVPNLRRHIAQPKVLVDVGGLPGFADIEATSAGVSLGAGVTLDRLATDPEIGARHAALAEAARAVAAPGHRAVATLGGNLCLDTRCAFYNQSAWWRAANGYCLKRGGTVCHVAPQGSHCHAAFCGDLAAALLALEASVEIASTAGRRSLPLADLYREDGAAHLTLEPGELLLRVHVPAAVAGARSGYRKARVRGAFDFPLAGVGAALTLRGDTVAALRVALTGTNARPLVLAGTEAFAGSRLDDALLQALGKLVQKQVSPMRTTLVAANYRRQVAAVLARRLVVALAAGSTGEGE